MSCIYKEYVHLTIIPASFVTSPKYIQTLHFALVGAFRRSVELPVATTTRVTVDQFCVTNLLLHYRIKIFKLWYAHACASIDIKIFILIL